MAKYQLSAEEKKMLRKASFRTLRTNTGGNKLVGSGRAFAQTMWPALDLYYKDKERRNKAFERHTGEFFNSHTIGTSLVEGISLAMEKQNAEMPEDQNMDAAISGVKASLMGPLAGIGDSLFQNVVRVVIAGICIGIGSETGNPLAFFLFLLLNGGINLTLKLLGLRYGFIYGVDFVNKAFSEGLIPLITRAGSILGSIMVGALIGQQVKLSTIVKYVLGSGETAKEVVIQDILDGIMPGLLPLLLFTLVMWLLQKKKVNSNVLIFGMMGVFIILSFLHIV